MSDIYFMAYNHSCIRIKFKKIDDIKEFVLKLKQYFSDWNVDIYDGNEYLCTWHLDDLIEEVSTHYFL